MRAGSLALAEQRLCLMEVGSLVVAAQPPSPLELALMVLQVQGQHQRVLSLLAVEVVSSVAEAQYLRGMLALVVHLPSLSTVTSTSMVSWAVAARRSALMKEGMALAQPPCLVDWSLLIVVVASQGA